ncbi:MAG: cyclic peptide export ABC transporter [Acidobacteriota bacterium]
MKLFRFLLKTARYRILAAAVMSVVSGASSTALLAVVNQQANAAESSGMVRALWAFVGLSLLLTATRLVSLYILQTLGQSTAFELRLQMAKRVLRAPLRHLETLGGARILAVLTGDIGTLAATVALLPVAFTNASIVIGCIAYLGWLSPALFYLFIALFVVGIATYQVPFLLGLRRIREARQVQDALFGNLNDLTGGIKELKLYREQRAAYLSSLRGNAERQRRLQVTSSMIFGSSAAWGNLFLFFVVGILLFAQPSIEQIPREILPGAILVIIYLLAPLQFFLNSLPQFGAANIALERIDTIEASFAEHGTHEERDELSGNARFTDLCLRDVCFEYVDETRNHRFSLGPISLSAGRGELIFLVGGNGSGKTTLAKILLGLYHPDEGEVLLNGEVVTRQSSDAYRQSFSAVFADFHLFQTLPAIGGQESDAAARAYLEKLQIENKVSVDDGTLSTLALSQGQRKRLALLTAYLTDRPIYLFDEWAADQDPYFKRIFYDEFLPELKRRGKTVFVISHDDSYYPLADRIIKLEDGKIISDGRVRRDHSG